MEIDPKNSAHPSDGVAASRRSERGAVRTVVLRDDWSYRASDLHCGPCTANVYQGGMLLEGVWEEPRIGWSSISPGNVEQAEQMATVMRAAIQLAKRWRNRVGKPVKYPKKGATP